MSIDVHTETLIQLSEYPNHAPRRRGKKQHKSTGYRHAYQGVGGVLLETAKLAGIRYTSLEAIDRFWAATAAAADRSAGASSNPNRSLKAERKREIAAAEVELDVAGI